MSLEQYKDANRKELWEILQIQIQVSQAEVAKNAEIEVVMFNLLSLSSFAMSFPFEYEKLKALKEREL
jgi:hypothetical protein